MTEQKPLWYGTSGPPDAPIVIVAESWGYEESISHRPLIGQSGNELNRMLAEAGYKRDEILCTNVVAERPKDNEMWRFFHPADSAKERKLPSIGGLHPQANVIADVDRLYKQIGTHPRRLVIAAGNWSLWALTNCANTSKLRSSNNRAIPKELQPLAPAGISTWRGSMWYALESRLDEGASYSKTPLLPIIHPAAIMRDWSQRAVTVHDLRARIRMALRSDWRRSPAPIFYAPPTFDQCLTKLTSWLVRLNAGHVVPLCCDIETKSQLITVVGLCDSVNFAMAIPFFKRTSLGFDSYWTTEQEVTIVRLLQRLLTHPNIRVIGQNFIYDTQYFQHWMICTPPLWYDTMLVQNTMFPGTPKALDYLSSLYCRYYWYWKEDSKEWDGTGTLEELLTYNCQDLINTFECSEAQQVSLKHYGMEEQWKEKLYINGFCLDMMNRGVATDRNRIARYQIRLAEYIGSVVHEIQTIVPQWIVDPEEKENRRKKKDKYVPWYNSAHQTKKLFYNILGFRVVFDRKTKRPTTGKEALNQLLKWYPEYTGLFERLRNYATADNTAQVLRSQVDSDGRMRCSYNPGGTESHRLSSSKNAMGGGTNLQNLTKGKDDEDDEELL